MRAQLSPLNRNPPLTPQTTARANINHGINEPFWEGEQRIPTPITNEATARIKEPTPSTVIKGGRVYLMG